MEGKENIVGLCWIGEWVLLQECYYMVIIE